MNSGTEAVEAAQNRATQCFLGVASRLAIQGNIGSVPGSVQWNCEMTQL